MYERPPFLNRTEVRMSERPEYLVELHRHIRKVEASVGRSDTRMALTELAVSTSDALKAITEMAEYLEGQTRAIELVCIELADRLDNDAREELITKLQQRLDLEAPDRRIRMVTPYEEVMERMCMAFAAGFR